MRALSVASDWLWPVAQPFPDRLGSLSVICEGKVANTASRFSAPACRSAWRIPAAGLPSPLLFSGTASLPSIHLPPAMEGLRGGLSLAGLLSLLLVAGVVEEASSEVLCGVPSLGRIVGGSDARSGQWPWQADLNFNGHHACGATLIAPQWLVSAAHCFPKVNDIELYAVTLGSYQLNNPSPDLQATRIDQVIKHPDFSEDNSSQGDIALVKLKVPVSYSRTIRPICLPASSVNFPQGMTCTVTGWGNIHESTSLPSPMTLQQLEVPIIGLDTCRCLYRRNPDPEESHTLHRDMMCAGFVEGKKDACQGDSGGPLSCLVDKAWFLAGVVSWGSSCGAANRPGVYIRLPFYADWIKEKVPEVQLQQVTVPTKPTPEEPLCSNSTGGGGAYDDLKPSPGWNRPLGPDKGTPNSSVSLACRVGLPLLLLLLLQTCLW